MKQPKTKLVTRLRILLAEWNIKQYELAQKAGISQTTVSAIARDEWDRISRDVIIAICETLNCQPGDLFTLEKIKPRKVLYPDITHKK